MATGFPFSWDDWNEHFDRGTVSMEKDDDGNLHSVTYDYEESYVAVFWDKPELNHTFVAAHWSPLIPDEGLKDHTRYERLYHRPADLLLAWRHGWNVRAFATAPRREIDAYAEWKAANPTKG